MSSINFEQLGLKAWTKDDLSKEDNFNWLKSFALEFAQTLNPGDANALYLILTDLINAHGAELSQKLLVEYQKLVTIFGMLAWVDRSEQEIKDYLSNHLIFIIKTPLPIMGLMVSRLKWYKAELKVHLDANMGYIRENQELLGNPNLNYKFPAANQSPTVANWLTDYIVWSGSPQELDSLNLLKYFTENPNVRLLNKEENKILKRILKLYTILNNPFKHQPFYEFPYLFDDYFETGNQPGVPQPTIFETSQPVTRVTEDNLSIIKNIYSQTLDSLRQKYAFEAEAKKYTIQDLTALTLLLKNNQKDAKVVLSVLLVFAQKDLELKILNTAGTALGQTSQVLGNLKKIIQNLMLGCGLTESETAVYLNYLGTINKHLQGFSYADLQSMQFKLK